MTEGFINLQNKSGPEWDVEMVVCGQNWGSQGSFGFRRPAEQYEIAHVCWIAGYLLQQASHSSSAGEGDRY